MDDNLRIKLLGKLLTDSDLKTELNLRKKDSVFKSDLKSRRQDYIDDGWEEDKEFKTKFRFKKSKPLDILFEDQVWSLFANLGFKFLNKDRNFHMPYNSKNETQQIDVLAVDDESIVFVECKASNEVKHGDFKKELEAMKMKIAGLKQNLQNLFPSSKHKIKFVFATKNYSLGKADLDRLANIGGIHFDMEIINYYHEMYRQIGLATRYQLLGLLFEGQEIPELDNLIPAVKGKMGSHTYYSFSIEPEKLLKIGYVLHRNKANRNMMPTYQRIIKRSRLKGVQEFIDNGGYFPNSIIISIDGPKKGLDFNQANTQVKSAIASVGILHLPKKFRSAFIIDGQHRLYGYSNSKYKSTNSIPVVAFENLDPDEQVRLFMDINGKQKAVPKNLRNTLEADLKWSSESYLEQMAALKSKIALELGENMNSPLFDRVLIGENKKSNKRCVTMEAIKKSLKNSNFLGKVTKSSIEATGTFYKGDLQGCFDNLSDYLIKSFNYLSLNIKDEWEKGDNDGVASINKGVTGFIMYLSSVVDHIFQLKLCSHKSTPKKIFEESKTYIDCIINFYKDLNSEQRLEFRKAYGAPADTKFFRAFQLATQETHKNFKPIGLEEYLIKEAKQFNEESFKMIRDIETHFKRDFKEKLESLYDKSWWKKGTPPDVYEKAMGDAIKKNREIENEDEEVTGWDCLTLISYRKIAIKNWGELFEKDYTRPSEKKIPGGRDAKTKWMVKINQIRNQNFHTYSVTEDEFNFLLSIHDWLINNK